MLKISNVEKSYRTAHGFQHRQVSIVKVAVASQHLVG